VLTPDLTQFIGIPYRKQGRSMQGADCGGLVLLVLRAYGLSLPDFSCAQQSELVDILNNARGTGMLEKIAAPEVPCLVSMATATEAPHVVNHVGVYVGKGNMLHTRSQRVSQLVRLSNPCISRTLRGFYRVC